MKKKLRLTIDIEVDIPDHESLHIFGTNNLSWTISGRNGYEGPVNIVGWNISTALEDSWNTFFYSKQFTCGNSYISREELEGFSMPFNTKNVSDETMLKLVEAVDRVTKERLHLPTDMPLDFANDKIGDIWWDELEIICRELNIPYYNENEN